MNDLIQALIRAEALLRSVGIVFWAEKLADVLQGCDGNLGLYRLNEVLSWFGGMGSLNDLIISPRNKHSVTAQDAPRLDRELHHLLDVIYNEAKYLQRIKVLEP